MPGSNKSDTRCRCHIFICKFWMPFLFLVIIAFASSAGAFSPAHPSFYGIVGSVNPSRIRFGNSYQISNDRGRRITRVPSITLSAIPAGLEDVIFSNQNAASNIANSVINDSNGSNIRSIPLLYAAGLITSFSPCSLGLLPITISYITNAANQRKDRNTFLPTLAFALGLGLVFTALGVSASVLGGVFGSGIGDGTLSSLLLAAIGSLVSVFMGLQLLELIEIPLPSLDFRLRSAVLESGQKGNNESLFDANGGLILENLNNIGQESEGKSYSQDNEATQQQTDDTSDEFGALIRTFLLGGTSALVASPCATPVLASLLAYLAMASSSGNDLFEGVTWMLSYTLGYSTPLLLVGATGGQALVNLQNSKNSNDGMDVRSILGQWITPLTGGILIVFGMNGFLVALLGDPSLAGLAPIIE